MDPDLFLGAKAEVMEHVLKYVQSGYGSVTSYLSQHGFDKVWRDKLRLGGEIVA